MIVFSSACAGLAGENFLLAILCIRHLNDLIIS